MDPKGGGPSEFEDSEQRGFTKEWGVRDLWDKIGKVGIQR